MKGGATRTGSRRHSSSPLSRVRIALARPSSRRKHRERRAGLAARGGAGRSPLVRTPATPRPSSEGSSMSTPVSTSPSCSSADSMPPPSASRRGKPGTVPLYPLPSPPESPSPLNLERTRRLLFEPEEEGDEDNELQDNEEEEADDVDDEEDDCDDRWASSTAVAAAAADGDAAEDVAEEDTDVEAGDMGLPGRSSSLWLPLVCSYLPFDDLMRASSTCREWKVICTEPSLVLGHAAEALRLGEASNLGRFAADDSLFLREICVVAALAARLREGDPQPSSVPSYRSFISTFLLPARSMRSLRWHLPQLLRGIEMHSSAFLGIDLELELAVGPELADAAEFALVAIRALTRSEKRLAAALQCYINPDEAAANDLFHLRLVFESEPKFAVFMDPVRNTVHVSTTEEDFLVEHLPNAVRSLATFCSICGYCSSPLEVEMRVKGLLGLVGIERNQALSESEHSHCLFKLALYHDDLNGKLEGLVIQPSTSFSFDRSTGVLSFEWSASWVGSVGSSESDA